MIIEELTIAARLKNDYYTLMAEVSKTCKSSDTLLNTLEALKDIKRIIAELERGEKR
jgi:lambda repressor-like predicted transcriptional regulator